jgi:hypothetical protein
MKLDWSRGRPGRAGFGGFSGPNEWLRPTVRDPPHLSQGRKQAVGKRFQVFAPGQSRVPGPGWTGLGSLFSPARRRLRDLVLLLVAAPDRQLTSTSPFPQPDPNKNTTTTPTCHQTQLGPTRSLVGGFERTDRVTVTTARKQEGFLCTHPCLLSCLFITAPPSFRLSQPATSATATSVTPSQSSTQDAVAETNRPRRGQVGLPALTVNVAPISSLLGLVSAPAKMALERS